MTRQVRRSRRMAQWVWLRLRLRRKLRERCVRYQVEQLETALNLAARGLAVLLCPPLVIRRYNELVREQFQLEQLAYPKGMKPVKMGIYLVKRRSTLVRGDINAAVAAVARDLETSGDVHASAAAKRHLAGVLLRRVAAQVIPL